MVSQLSKKVFLCSKGEVPPGEARRFEIEGHRIAVVRIEDDFYAIGDRCSHANYSLSEGEIYPEDREIECWKHGSTFSLVDGKPQSFPATKPVPVYDIYVEDEKLFVSITGGGEE